jgi:hypothetical protein
MTAAVYPYVMEPVLDLTCVRKYGFAIQTQASNQQYIEHVTIDMMSLCVERHHFGCFCINVVLSDEERNPLYLYASGGRVPIQGMP